MESYWIHWRSKNWERWCLCCWLYWSALIKTKWKIQTYCFNFFPKYCSIKCTIHLFYNIIWYILHFQGSLGILPNLMQHWRTFNNPTVAELSTLLNLFLLWLTIQGWFNASSAENLFLGSRLNKHMMKSMASSPTFSQALPENLNGSYLMASKISSSASPLKGGYPHSNMYAMMPMDQTSHDWSYFPRSNSGLM